MREQEWSGRLSTLVVLERRSGEPDGAGGLRAVWTRVASLWAAVSVARSSGNIEGERREKRTRYRVWLRDRTDISLDDRLVWQDHIHVIIDLVRDPLFPDRLELIVERQP